MRTIKNLFQSRKFIAMFTGIITSALAVLIAHFTGEEKAQQLAQSIAGMIMLGVSVYAGSQGIADHGDINYGKPNDAEIKAIIDGAIK